MKCGGCGVEAEWGGEHRPDNGRVCWECDAFTCHACFAAFELLDTEFADRDLCSACNCAPITFPAASSRGAITQNQRPQRANATASEKRAMNTNPFDNDTTDPQVQAVIVGRSTHPGYIDLPFIIEEVLVDGRLSPGAPVDVATLDVDDVMALAAVLDDYKRDVQSQVQALERRINDRLYTLDVTGTQVPLGIAA